MFENGERRRRTPEHVYYKLAYEPSADLAKASLDEVHGSESEEDNSPFQKRGISFYLSHFVYMCIEKPPWCSG